MTKQKLQRQTHPKDPNPQRERETSDYGFFDERGGPSTRQTMRFLMMQRPVLVAAVGCLARPATIPTIVPRTLQLANAAVQGRRHASVKAQGAYKKKTKSGIPKKLGAKRTG
ncbi:hypothetical protein E4U33_003074, partial [Claviceps sp. LM78 group G4]